MSRSITLRPLIEEVRFRFQENMRFVADKVELEQDFLRVLGFDPVHTISLKLCIFLHLHVALLPEGNTEPCSGTSQKATPFRNSGSIV